ncbi:hypothetical protein [Micromonospora sp. NPDC048839]|uniref:hypothetical protein n=1 Tax=Micromonospora sp. NPDC048839 TaxID=3155641 RepID=UPI003409B15F
MQDQITTITTTDGHAVVYIDREGEECYFDLGRVATADTTRQVDLILEEEGLEAVLPWEAPAELLDNGMTRIWCAERVPA